MATLRVLRFDAEADPAPLAADPTPADSDRYAREHADVKAWKSRDTAACIALSSLLPESEETHITQVRTASEFLTAIKARCATPTTVSLGRLFLPFLFPDLASFERTTDLITHLRSLDSSYHAACTDAQLAVLPPPMAITIHFITTSLPDRLASVRDALLLKHPNELTIEVLESALKDVESNLRSVASASGVVPPPLFHKSGKRGSQGAGGGGGGGGGDVASGGGGSAGAGGAPPAAAGDSPATAGGGDAWVPTAASLVAAATHQDSALLRLLTRASDFVYSSVVSLGASLAKVHVASVGTCVDTSPGAALEDASLSFTLDSGASHSFFRDCTTLTLLPTPVCVALADTTSGLVTARYTTTLPLLARLRFVSTGTRTRLLPPLPLSRALVSTHFTLALEGSSSSSSSSSSGISSTSADKISPRGVSCVFLGFPENSSNYTFYHPPLHRFFDSPDVSFNESVPYYVRYPCRGLPVPPAPLFLTSTPPPAPPVQPPPFGPAPLGVSHTTPPPSIAPQVQPPFPQSSSQPTADPVGAGFRGEDPRGASSGGAGVGAESVTVRGPGSGGVGVGAEPVTARDSSLQGADVSGAVPGCATTGGAPSAGPGEPGTDPVTSGGAGSRGGATGSLESGAAAVGARGERVGAAAAGATAAGAAAAAARARAAEAAAAAPAAATSSSCLWSSNPCSPLSFSSLPPPSPSVSGPLLPPPDPSPVVFPPPLPPLSPPLSHTWPSRRSPRACPSSPVPFTDLHTALFRSSPPHLSPSVLPSPPESALIASLSTPVTDYYRTHRPVLSRVLASLVTDPRASLSSVSALTAAATEFASTRCLDYATSLVAAPPTSPLAIGGKSALGCDALEDRQFELEFLAAASPHLCAMLLGYKGDPDALDIPTPRTYAEVVSGPWASQWRAAMDSEMASYRSTCTYVDKVPPLGANVVDGMWIFRVKRPPGSPPVFKAHYVDRGFSQCEGVDFFHNFAPTLKMTTLRVLLHVPAQRDYELHSLDFSTAFLQGSLHKEVWLRCPSAFTGTFPPGTQWRLRRPVYV
ncbi:unnamed protein product [Closterium sp. NIES-53]